MTEPELNLYMKCVTHLISIQNFQIRFTYYAHVKRYTSKIKIEVTYNFFDLINILAFRRSLKDDPNQIILYKCSYLLKELFVFKK